MAAKITPTTKTTKSRAARRAEVEHGVQENLGGKAPQSDDAPTSQPEPTDTSSTTATTTTTEPTMKSTKRERGEEHINAEIAELEQEIKECRTDTSIGQRARKQRENLLLQQVRGLKRELAGVLSDRLAVTLGARLVHTKKVDLAPTHKIGEDGSPRVTLLIPFGIHLSAEQVTEVIDLFERFGLLAPAVDEKKEEKAAG